MNIKEAKRNGYYVELSDRGERIHSQYDPAKEAQRLLPDQAATPPRYLVLGGGLGYVLDGLSKLDPDAEVLVAEPNPELLTEGQERNIWSPEAFDRCQIIDPDVPDLFQELGRFFSLRGDNEVQVIRWPQYQELHPDFFQNILDKTSRLQQLHRDSLRVLQFEGPTWVKHMRQNLRQLKKHQTPTFTNKREPVAFVSAGPSLDYQINWLRNQEASVHVLVGNTAGPILTHYEDIKPDAHVFIDANEPLLDDLKQSRVNHLIMSPFVDPEIHRFYNGTLSFLAIETPLTEWMASADFLPSVQAGGAISATVLSWLSETPLEPIILLGCDMELRHGRYYSKGTARETIEGLNNLNRFQSLPDWHLIEKYLNQSGGSNLLAERDWFKERSKTMKQLNVPTHPPKWWEGEVGLEEITNPAGDFTLLKPDDQQISDWIENQQAHLENLMNGKPVPETWSTFQYWIEKIMPEPEQELSAWKTMFNEIN